MENKNARDEFWATCIVALVTALLAAGLAFIISGSIFFATQIFRPC